MQLYFVAYDGMFPSYLGRSRRSTGFYERDTDRMNLNNTVADLMAGEFDDAIAVYEADPQASTWIDASEDVARMIASRCEDERRSLPKHLIPFFEKNMGVSATLELVEREYAS